MCPVSAGEELADGYVSAGADLSELKHISTLEARRTQYLRDLSDAIRRTRKPIIASVEGFAVGFRVFAKCTNEIARRRLRACFDGTRKTKRKNGI